MKLTHTHLHNLHIGATFLSCLVDPEWVRDHTEAAHSRMQRTGEQPVLSSVDQLHPDDTVLTVGFVNSGLPLSEIRPCGDEFMTSVRLIEQAIEAPVRGLIPLAAANVNAIVPALLSMQLDIPIIDADPQGRVFPLVNQNVFALEGLPVRYIAATGPTGESALVTVDGAIRAERILRALATEFGGWAAAALYPMTAATLQAHGLLGTVSRMIRVGEVLESDTTTPEKLHQLRTREGVFRTIRARVTDTTGMAQPPEPGKPGLPSSVVMKDLERGRIIQLEIYNEILMVLIDGVIAAAMPDITTLFNPATGRVADIEDFWVGNTLDIMMMRGGERWYEPDGLTLAGQLGLQHVGGGRRLT